MQSFNREIKVLLVNPETPPSYWGLQGSTSFVGARAAHVPLPLITLAALLPPEWRLKLVDMNVQKLRDKDIVWADVVLVTGMIIQRVSMESVLERCKALGVPTVVGGPFVSSSPDAPELSTATSLAIGEAEEEDIIGRLIEDIGAGAIADRYVTVSRPDLRTSPIPRYDLLRRRAYCVMSVQVSRGCPHGCEFCNVRVLFGRKPRYKSPEQVTAELQAIYDTGYRGNVFFVDDNFIGRPRKAAIILRAVDQWQEANGRPFQFFTEADIRLAERDDLIDLMTAAGFFAVFIGFESPSEEALKSSAKTQNVGVDAVEAVRRLRTKGLDVYGGFIVGFDTDGPECGRLVQEMVDASSIDLPMPGMLIAIPGTPLERRLRKEGRLVVHASTGDQFEIPNIIPKRMTRVELLRLYHDLIEQMYRPKHYFERAYRALSEWKHGAVRRATAREWLAVMRSVLWQGIFSTYSLHYWRFLIRTLIRHPHKASRAFAIAIFGHHFFVYTRKVVLPRLRAAEQALLAEEALSQPAG